VREPALGVDGAVGDVAAPVVHLRDGRRLHAIERRPHLRQRAQEVLQRGVVERGGLDAAQLVREVVHRRTTSSPAVPGESSDSEHQSELVYEQQYTRSTDGATRCFLRSLWGQG
jgi:hypothetical protein